MVFHKWYETKEDAADALAIRQEVFVDEQHFKEEFDEIDSTAHHVVLYEETKPIACGRIFPDEKDPDSWHLGRIAVRGDYRGSGLGRLLLIVMEIRVVEQGGKRALIGAQSRAAEFYQKCGYAVVGEPYMEEYCQHLPMEKSLI